MENRTHAIVAVSFLLVLVLGLVLVFYWLSHQRSEPLAYEIVTSQSIGGLAAQSDVTFKGITVGHVVHVGFDPANRSHVIIRITLEPKTYVTHATYAVVAKQGLAGGSALELKLGKGSQKPLDTNATHPTHIPLHKGLLASLEANAREDMKKIKDILSSVKKLLGTDNRQHIAASLKQIDTLTRRLTKIEAQMPALIKSTQQSVDQSHKLLANANDLVKQAQTPVQKAADLEDSMQALAKSSRQLSERLNRQTAPDFNQLSNSLLETSRQLDDLLRELKAKPQSLIFGPPKRPPGPGEPGFDGQPKEDSGHE
jgi:phospholipid/cholesterol/gamma-HCH transport system substrate-binding protein